MSVCIHICLRPSNPVLLSMLYRCTNHKVLSLVGFFFGSYVLQCIDSEYTLVSEDFCFSYEQEPKERREGESGVMGATEK